MVTCPACGQENPEGFRLCGMCGAALAPAREPSREERKVVTILFTDLVGSTARAEGLDPEDVRATLSAYYAQLRAELERHGGTVEKFIGDAVMAIFGAPVAHEDDAERAVRAALAIRDSIGEELQIRTAVNTGEALVALGARTAEGEGMVSGDVVNTAARLQSAAPVNGILVGEGTYRATRNAIDYSEAPPVEAKGKSEPVKVWEAVGARSRFGSDVEQKLRTPLVGRERERGLLADALTHARAEQSAQLVTLVGVPGIGKSRLVAELFQITEADPDLISWRQGRSLPYGERVSFWALGEIVKAHAGILESDDAATAEEKLVAMVDTLVEEDEREREWLARHTRPLVGLEGAERAEREEAFAAWRRLLEAAAEQRPLVLVFEDLHWADDGLLDFVDHLADWATTVPLLIVATARPELLDRRPGWGGGKRNAFTLSIGALTDEETAVLLQRLLDRAVLDADAQRAVLQRAEGNPLYAEEYARMLAEQDGGDLPLPETVQGLIAARIDGLAPAEKALLQDASVIGKVFWPGALPGADERILHALERKEFVRRDRRSSITGETQYAFLHALVRDVGSGQIPRAERAEKHRRPAEWPPSLAGDRSEDHAEMLAHHYREALSLAEAAGMDTRVLTEPARQSFADAAQRALSLGAGAAAHELALEALELTGEDDPDRPHLQLLAGYAVRLTGSFELASLVEPAIEGFLALGDPGRAAEACVLLGSELFYRGDIAATRAARNRGLELARTAPPSPAVARAIASVARSASVLDRNFDQALELAREALALADEAGDDETAFVCLNTIGMARVYSGDIGGIEDLELSVDRAEPGGSVFHHHSALNNLANCLWHVGRLEEGSRRIHEARELCEHYGFESALVWNDAELAYDSYFRGDLEGVVSITTEFLSREDVGYQIRPILATRAQALLARGQIDEALADAELALAGLREAGADAQVAPFVLNVAAACLRAAGRHQVADDLLAEVLAGWQDEDMYDLPLGLIELGRGEEYLALTEGTRGHVWREAGRSAASGELVRASELYGSMGARFPEAWAGLLAAERGDTSRLDAALAYFEEQRATPYAQRCRALLQASA
jgi:class 3 adenylate cyclase/tetratricopeptide (TPR) repeat protein